MKRKINRQQKDFLEQELKYLKSQHAKIDIENLDDYYEVEKPSNQSSLHTFLWVGAVLVGIGFLLFIASNWSALSSITKYFMIFFGVIIFYVTARWSEQRLPRTARSFYYLGCFLYGAGIFLVGQTFHLGGAAYQAFLLWALGIMPLAYYLKDQVIIIFSILFLFFYSLQIYALGEFAFFLLIFIPTIYYCNHFYMRTSRSVFFLNSFLLLHFIHSSLWYWGWNEFVLTLCLFIVGVLASYKPLNAYKETMAMIGYMLIGGYGIALTFPSVWESISGSATAQVMAIIFSLLYGVYLIFLIRKGVLFSIVILCGLLVRFYIDISYAFLPKSLFFIIGGVILILFGIWFEKSRKGEQNHEYTS